MNDPTPDLQTQEDLEFARRILRLHIDETTEQTREELSPDPWQHKRHRIWPWVLAGLAAGYFFMGLLL